MCKLNALLQAILINYMTNNVHMWVAYVFHTVLPQYAIIYSAA